MNGEGVPVAARLFRHSNVQMTLRYAHLAHRGVETTAERASAAMARIMDAASY